MAKGKPPFAGAPARAMRPLTYFNKERQRGEELTALDLRVLMCICWHDRLSISKAGAGCYASNARMSAEVGCTMPSLSRSIAHLIAAGLIERDYGGVPGKRHLTVYRVLYDPDDVQMLEQIVTQSGNNDLPNRANDERQSFTRDADEAAQSFTRADHENGGNPLLVEGQETSLREGRDSIEIVERNSSEEARFARCSPRKIAFEDNAGAQLATLERALKAGTKIDCTAWFEWIDNLIGYEDDEHILGWATRLSEQVVDAMDEDEYRAWGEEHGWCDDEGNWHAPHPRRDDEITDAELSELNEALAKAAAARSVGKVA